MDHIRISGTYPHQWSLGKQSSFKNCNLICQKYQNKLKSKGVVLLTHNITISINLTRTILMLSKRYESTEVDRRTWLYVLSGTHWSTTSDTNQVEI